MMLPAIARRNETPITQIARDFGISEAGHGLDGVAGTAGKSKTPGRNRTPCFCGCAVKRQPVSKRRTLHVSTRFLVRCYSELTIVDLGLNNPAAHNYAPTPRRFATTVDAAANDRYSPMDWFGNRIARAFRQDSIRRDIKPLLPRSAQDVIIDQIP